MSLGNRSNPALGKVTPKPQAALGTVSSNNFPVLAPVELFSQKLGSKFYGTFLIFIPHIDLCTNSHPPFSIILLLEENFVQN